jgi:sulfur carrier protein
MAIELLINGTSYSFDRQLTGGEVLAELGIPAATVVIELNAAIIKREAFLGLPLNSGDRLELVTVVGGG